MAFVQFKNKGALVFIYIALALIVAGVLCYFVSGYFPEKFTTDVFMVCAGVTILIAGYLVQRAEDDHFIDEQGEKHYMHYDNQFMFIPMKVWTWILYAVGIFLFLAVLADYFDL